MTKEEAIEFLNKLDPYYKCGAVTFKFDNLHFVSQMYEYAKSNYSLLYETDGQFSGGYSSEIYRGSETETVIFCIDPDGKPIQAECRSKENND